MFRLTVRLAWFLGFFVHGDRSCCYEKRALAAWCDKSSGSHSWLGKSAWRLFASPLLQSMCGWFGIATCNQLRRVEKPQNHMRLSAILRPGKPCSWKSPNSLLHKVFYRQDTAWKPGTFAWSEVLLSSSEYSKRSSVLNDSIKAPVSVLSLQHQYNTPSWYYQLASE